MQIEFPVRAETNYFIGPDHVRCVIRDAKDRRFLTFRTAGDGLAEAYTVLPEPLPSLVAVAEALNVLEQAACLLREGITITAGGAVASRIKAAASMLKGEPV